MKAPQTSVSFVPMPSNSDLLRVEDVAQRLKLGRTKVYELIGCGELECIKIGRSCRIIATSVDIFITRKLQEARNG